jgi:hypothetical protein
MFICLPEQISRVEQLSLPLPKMFGRAFISLLRAAREFVGMTGNSRPGRP